MPNSCQEDEKRSVSTCCSTNGCKSVLKRISIGVEDIFILYNINFGSTSSNHFSKKKNLPPKTDELKRLRTMRLLTLLLKPVIEISLNDGQQKDFVPSYTSRDHIQGFISITARHDTPFDEIYVTFEGTTKTFVEKVSTALPANGRTEAFHVFLRLIQPIDGESLPEDLILRAGQTYSIPFTFVVPERILPQSCTHSPTNPKIHDLHLNLPPSLGDPLAASIGNILLDDMAPEMAVVSYAVKVRLFHGRNSSGKLILVADTARKLRIMPASAEQRPIPFPGGLKDDYRPRKEKVIKRGMFKGGKLGCLTMESSQPKSLRLPPLSSTSASRHTPSSAYSSCPPVTTMATVNLRFDPAESSAPPPKLSSLTTKLKVATFFSSAPLSDLPTRITDFHYSSSKGVHVETIQLSARCVASAQWNRHSPTSSPYPASPSSSTLTSFSPTASSFYNGGVFYTTQILVPVTLPSSNNTTKTFVPTFHSCLVSRTYALDLYLGTQAVGTTNLHIKLPVQVSMRGRTEEEHAPEYSALPPPDTPTRSNSTATTTGSSGVAASVWNSSTSTLLRTESEHQQQSAPPGYSSFSSVRNGRIRYQTI